MRIINLKAENVKKLIAVDITPDENMVVISGKNGAGKSSLLDSIWYALAGKNVIPQKPIREGQEKATIQLDLGDVVVERVFTDKGTTVKVSTVDGAKYAKPQEMLDSLLGAICFDPLMFSRLKPRDQYDQIKVILGFGDELEQLEAARLEKYDQRRDINRTLKEGEAMVDSLASEIDDQTPDDPIDINEQLQKLDSMKREISEHDALKESFELKDSKIAEIECDIGDIENRLAKLKESLVAAKEEKNKIQAQIMEKAKSVPTEQDISSVSDNISKAQSINAAVEKKKTLAKYKARVDELQKASDALTSAIEEIDGKKEKIISDADIPVKGLGLEDGQVYFNGLPFNQLCSAEKLRISTYIAMSANPKLRIVRIQDGALLDSDGMKTLETMAKENDFQVWVERVDSTEPVSIVIEDGKVKEATQKLLTDSSQEETNGSNKQGQLC